jgi:HSP20 family molecular chaperone IbpA
MLEEIFGKTIPMGPNEARMRFRVSRTDNESVSEERSEDVRVEKIELDDRIIIVVDGLSNDSEPFAEIEGRQLKISFNTPQHQDRVEELPYPIDAEKSSMAFNHGIVELELVKAENEDTSSDFREVELRAE